MRHSVVLPAFRPSAPRSDGREHVIFESIVALLALLLIISGFSLYVSQAFAKEVPLDTSLMQVASPPMPAEPPYSLAER